MVIVGVVVGFVFEIRKGMLCSGIWIVICFKGEVFVVMFFFVFVFFVVIVVVYLV